MLIFRQKDSIKTNEKEIKFEKKSSESEKIITNVIKIDERFFKKINNNPYVNNNVSRNCNNLFSQTTVYKKFNQTEKISQIVKKTIKFSHNDRNITKKHFINTSTNYDFNTDDKNFSNVEKTIKIKKINKKLKEKYLIKK